jgi:5-methylcytosine-specific restriction endonuclease McrA
MAQHHGRAGRPWRRLSAQVKARARNGEPCWLCGHRIDTRLGPLDPLSFAVDHVIPLARGGSPHDPSNLRPSHRRCNARKGDREAPAVRTSRAW